MATQGWPWLYPYFVPIVSRSDSGFKMKYPDVWLLNHVNFHKHVYIYDMSDTIKYNII